MRPRLQHWGSVAGDSASSVQRIWRVHLQPHRVQQFKLSNDPKFTDKLRDVVGLYVDPPAHASSSRSTKSRRSITRHRKGITPPTRALAEF
jgi:hypothetical protein